jgi:hypothetical protein
LTASSRELFSLAQELFLKRVPKVRGATGGKVSKFVQESGTLKVFYARHFYF